MEKNIQEEMKVLVERIQLDLTNNVDNPEALLMYANVFLGLGKEILQQISSPTQALSVFDFYRTILKQEIETTTIH